MRLAVIGTGIAGNAAAWLLSERHAVTVYERVECQWCHSQSPAGSTTCQTCGAPLDTADRVEALREALSRQETQAPVAVMERETVTVESKVAELMAALSRPGTLAFRTFIQSCNGPVEIVV